MNKLLLLSLFMLVGCAKTPLDVVKQRYENVGEKRTLELIDENNYTAIVVGRLNDKKCKQIETIALSKLNRENEWKIIRTHNEHLCHSDTNNSIKKEYLDWIKTNKKPYYTHHKIKNNFQ